jgi:transcriptional regulator of nitric oxide reductase
LIQISARGVQIWWLASCSGFEGPILRLFGALLLASFQWSAAQAADLSAARNFFAGTQVVIEAETGSPPAAIVRGADGQLLAYAFSTRTVSGSVGYAGRPLDIVAAVSPQGVIAGAVIVAHEEPILVIGIPREALAAYVTNFRGYNVSPAAGLRPAGQQIDAGPHGVAGATVTSAVIRDAIVRSARAVLRTRAV